MAKSVQEVLHSYTSVLRTNKGTTMDYIPTVVDALCIIYFGWKIYTYFCGDGEEDESPIAEANLSTDDVLDWDELTDQPFVPIRIVKEQAHYYAWFSNNDKFAGQGKSLAQAREATYLAIFKEMGLTIKFKQEK
jgi:hypothetical protein